MLLCVSDPRLVDLASDEFFVTKGGRLVDNSSLKSLDPSELVEVHFRLNGGKGGFGSLLRAIGSQIHRTTDKKSMRNLDGTRIRAVEDEKNLVEARKRKAEKDKEDEKIREEKKARKMQDVVQNAAGHHGGKHFYEDEKFVKSKEKTTEGTIQAVAAAASKLKKDAELRKQKEEEERKRQEEDDSDSSCGEMEDEFMPVKTPINTGPTKAIQGGTATRGAKTVTHNNVMWSHMIGKNVDDAKQVELVTYEDIDLEEVESLDVLMELTGERLSELLMLRGLKTMGTIPERADRLWRVKGLALDQIPPELKAQR